jgi:hypothetical protein
MTVKTLKILVLSLFLLGSCSQQEDILFSASDELHFIKMFDKDDKFELCYNGFNTAIGKYSFINDTIYLTYTENKTITRHVNEKNYQGTENELLTRKLIIDSLDNRINSADNRNFCAFITINNLKKK